MPDFEAIRAGVLHALESGRLRAPIFDCVLVDEAQDMDTVAIEILKRVGRHVTVCMDGKQQFYDGRMSEQELVSFPDQMRERFGHLCFVGISRAVKWVYMSGENDSLIPAVQALYRADTRRFLDTKLSNEAVGLLTPAPATDTNAVVPDLFGLD